MDKVIDKPRSKGISLPTRHRSETQGCYACYVTAQREVSNFGLRWVVIRLRPSIVGSNLLNISESGRKGYSA